MTEQFNDDLKAAELEALKEQATKLGIKFHPSIGEEKLREKVKEAMDKVDEADPSVPETQETVAEISAPVQETPAQAIARQKAEMLKLVRVRITNMNPSQREWDSDIFQVSNALVNVKRAVPFNTEWHVEEILLKQIRQRRCQIFREVTLPNGKKKKEAVLIPWYAVEILPPLTEQQIKELAQRQAMAAGTSAL
jgi:hypothetical protein